jgi:hypothetical protein
MISWLRTLPDALVFLAIVGPILVLTLGACLVPGRFRREPSESNSEGFDAFLAVASAAAVLLAFSLVQVDTATRAIDDAVSKEAAAINSADRVLIRYGSTDLMAVRPMLLDYGRKIVEDEWPRLSHGDRSASADEAYTAISKKVRATEPTTPRQQAMYGEMLRYLDDMADLREQRINGASNGLPGLFWIATGLMVLIMILLAVRLEPRADRLWTTGAIAGAIGVLLSMIVVIDAPYHGDASAVTADAIWRAMDQMTKRI